MSAQRSELIAVAAAMSVIAIYGVAEAQGWYIVNGQPAPPVLCAVFCREKPALWLLLATTEWELGVCGQRRRGREHLRSATKPFGTWDAILSRGTDEITQR